MKKQEEYPRYCSITGEGMWSGYVVSDGTYIKHEEDLHDHCKKLGYDTIDAAHNDGIYYWTEWDDDDID